MTFEKILPVFLLKALKSYVFGRSHTDFLFQPRLDLLSVTSCKTEFEKLESDSTHLDERILIFIFLQSKEYKANVPPAVTSVIVTSGLQHLATTLDSFLMN